MTEQNDSTPQKKKRQHHVWQKYLNAWCANNKLYCLLENRIFRTGTISVAVEGDFYKIGKLTSADIALIEFLVINVPGIHPSTRKTHANFLSLTTSPQLFAGKSNELDRHIDAYSTNVLEEYHAGIERSFLPLLNRMLRSDLSFYADDQSCIILFHFLATQFMRTKGVSVRTIDILKEKDGIDASRIWPILSHMFANNIGMSLFRERRQRRLTLVENKTNVEFITGDQPLLNLHGDGQKPPTTLSWYYLYREGNRLTGAAP